MSSWQSAQPPRERHEPVFSLARVPPDRRRFNRRQSRRCDALESTRASGAIRVQQEPLRLFLGLQARPDLRVPLVLQEPPERIQLWPDLPVLPVLLEILETREIQAQPDLSEQLALRVQPGQRGRH